MWLWNSFKHDNLSSSVLASITFFHRSSHRWQTSNRGPQILMCAVQEFQISINVWYSTFNFLYFHFHTQICTWHEFLSLTNYMAKNWRFVIPASGGGRLGQSLFVSITQDKINNSLHIVKIYWMFRLSSTVSVLPQNCPVCGVML